MRTLLFLLFCLAASANAQPKASATWTVLRPGDNTFFDVPAGAGKPVSLWTSFPAKDPVRPDDLAATMFYLLGIDPATVVQGNGDRPVTITDGKPVMDVMG